MEPTKSPNTPTGKMEPGGFRHAIDLPLCSAGAYPLISAKFVDRVSALRHTDRHLPSRLQETTVRNDCQEPELASPTLPERDATDAPCPPAFWMAEGELMLQQLAHEARAARAEARQAELARILQQARDGNAAPLIAWLTTYRQQSATAHQAEPHASTSSLGQNQGREADARPPCAAIAGRSEGPMPSKSAEQSCELPSWEPVRQASLERLHARMRATQVAPPIAQPADRRSGETVPRVRVDGPTSNQPHSKSKRLDTAQLPADSVNSGIAKSGARPPSADQRPAAKPGAGKYSPGKRQNANGRSIEQKQRSPSKPSATPLRRPATLSPSSSSPSSVPNEARVAGAPSIACRQGSRVRSVVASAVAHLLLLIGLALVSLRMPQQDAGLSLSSATSASAETAFELSQPIELESPDEPSAAEVFQPQVEAAHEWMQQSISPVGPTAVPSLPPAATSLSSALASAAQAAVGATSSHSDASFFGAAAGGNCFCYVIDFSGSMRGGPWEAARAELLNSLATLQPHQRFYVILFHRELLELPAVGQSEPAEFPLYATAENLEHTRRWLLSLEVGASGREPSAAITEAIAKEPDAIYLLTDGVTAVKNVAEKILAANRVDDALFGEGLRTTIHTIAYYSLEGQALLQQIAAENQGQFLYVPRPTR